MASSAVKIWRSVANRGFATVTAPRMKPYAPTADFMHHGEHHATKAKKADFIPVYVALGMIALSLSCGAVTVKQQIAYNPSVRVHKKRRETIPEVEDPERVVEEADKYVRRSLFRRVARIQDVDAIRSGIPDPTRPDPFNSPRHVETLQSVGVNPRVV